jgi:hypothetical protein
MSVMKIEIVPDPSRPAGGHAIIRLKGVALLPPGATYRIDPIDETLNDGDDDGWPQGERHPIQTRQTPEGVELHIGPDVVDAPMLEPGTPVTISVPDGHVSAEVVWPDLPVSFAGTQSPVVMTPSQMAAQLATNEREKAEAANAAAVRAEEQRLARIRQDAAAAEAAREQEHMAQAARELEEALALEPIPLETGRPLNGLDKSVFAPPSSNPPNATPARTNQTSLSSLSKTAPERIDPMLEPERDLSLPAIVLKRSGQSAANGDQEPEPTVLRRETIEGRVVSQEPANRLMPFLAGAGLAGIAAAAVLALLLVYPRVTGGGEGIQTAAPALSAKTTLADAFTVSTQSPRGEIATDVDLPTALRLADHNLHGIDRPVDRAEAEFWLRKALSLTAGHSQLRWAMTQLGTLKAEPVTGPPDYGKARLLWEISAANGDPIAMCFLGTLLEHGLGIAADRAKALEYFKRAKDAGGCPNSDEAVARLSK